MLLRPLSYIPSPVGEPRQRLSLPFLPPATSPPSTTQTNTQTFDTPETPTTKRPRISEQTVPLNVTQCYTQCPSKNPPEKKRRKDSGLSPGEKLVSTLLQAAALAAANGKESGELKQKQKNCHLDLQIRLSYYLSSSESKPPALTLLLPPSKRGGVHL